jgi:hypothetical protein
MSINIPKPGKRRFWTSLVSLAIEEKEDKWN